MGEGFIHALNFFRMIFQYLQAEKQEFTAFLVTQCYASS